MVMVASNSVARVFASRRRQRSFPRVLALNGKMRRLP
jgi:hypothetical protein